MGGGLMQLVSYGAQDIYISGNPQITFWKVLYKRHTNFAMENRRVNFQGAPSWGNKMSTMLPRYADLISKMYLYMELPAFGRPQVFPGPDPYGWAHPDEAGFTMFEYAEIEIGGNVIDRQYSQWMYVWLQLTTPYDALVNLTQMTKISSTTGVANVTVTTKENADDPSRTSAIYVPLPFWFNTNPGLALPLISLQYHEVRLNLQLAESKVVTSDPGNLIQNKTTGVWNPTILDYDYTQPITANPPNLGDIALLVDYVYLDTEERRRFAQQSHEYLITQVQYSEDETITSQNANIDLTLNHPVKELFWILQPLAYLDCGTSSPALFDPTRGTVTVPHIIYPLVGWDVLDEAQLQLNGQERFEFRRNDYFTSVQPYQHHSGNSRNFPALAGQGGAGVQGGYIYSFALKPEEHQPSGTCNFSRIDKATLLLRLQRGLLYQTGPINFRLYATNYNVLRVMSGMAGLAFSN